MGFINKDNLIFYSIVLYFIIFYIVVYEIKPSFLFSNDGAIKNFGVGYKNKSIIPLWLFTLIIAVFSYLAILFICRVNIVF